jgi:RNA polymerase sigma-70 factor (ECF subfamily)
MSTAPSTPDDDLQARRRPGREGEAERPDPCTDADADADADAVEAIGDFNEVDDDGEDGQAAAFAREAAMASPATEPQLAAWLAAVVEQDERALAALYDATSARVFGLVQRIVRSAALAEEVVEDAYFQVWRQAARFDPARGKALTWLLAMARSRAIDALRREARFVHEALQADGHAEPACPQPAHDELLELAQHRADLHQALMLLGAQPRQLVSMSFFRGLSHEEIASQMELPLGTVKSQIRRALLTLREALAERGARLLAS